MMKEHTLKLDKSLCQDVYTGIKSFEVRMNDRDYGVGDIIRFQPIDKDNQPCNHPIQEKTYEITYLLDSTFNNETFIGLEDGWVVFSIKEIQYVDKTV